MKQHIGTNAVPIVNVSDFVETGDLIATIPDGALGANIHASVSGEVIKTGDTIVIKHVN